MPKTDCPQQQLFPAVLHCEGGVWGYFVPEYCGEVLAAAKQRCVVPESY